MPPRSRQNRLKITWQQAWQQAQAEMADPKAVIWLGPEVAQLLRPQPMEPVTVSPTSPQRKPLPLVLLLAGFMAAAGAISYLHAYRRIVSAPVDFSPPSSR